MSTEKTIIWEPNIVEARSVSKKSGKPVLAFFHYKHCDGCINTFKKTLTKMSVIDSINESFIPVLIETSERPGEAAAYNVDWTPTFIVLGHNGREAHRWVGYLPEDDFLANLDMARAMHVFKDGDYKGAERVFIEVLLKYPLTELAPMSMYYRGVARYRASADPEMLMEAGEELRDSYPESPWTIKASVWSREGMDSGIKAA